MRRWCKTTAGLSRHVVGASAFTGCIVATLVIAPSAAAADGWSRIPASAVAGSTVRVASSVTTLCQWVQPADVTPTSSTTGAPASTAPAATASVANAPVTANATGDRVTFDGTRVELRLEGTGGTIALGSVDVTPGGAWSGIITVPDVNVAAPGEYQLFAHCVVDNPALDGVRSFDFDPLPLTVADAPPPTTVTIPTEIGDAVTVTNPVQVQGEQLNRSTTGRRGAVATGPTLPKTGDGTLTVALSGFGALVLGAAALWWGSRKLQPVKP